MYYRWCFTLLNIIYQNLFADFYWQYIEKMQLKYNGEAEKSGVFVISACGFDSIPAESGILHAKQKFQGWVSKLFILLKLQCYLFIQTIFYSV